MATKKCPVCGTSVKVENLERHVRNQHPRETVDISALVTKEERRQVVREEARHRRKVTPGGFTIVLVVAGIVALVLFVVILNPFGNVGPNVGQTAPDFTLDSSEGVSISLSSFRGKPVLLEFMDVECSVCKDEAPYLATTYGNYGDRVAFLSVDVNFYPQGDTDNNQEINDFRSTYGTAWPYMLDANQAVSVSKYGVDSTPRTFILDKNGVILDVFRGAAPSGAQTYADALDRALKV